MDKNIGRFLKSFVIWFSIFYLGYTGWMWLTQPDEPAVETSGQLSIELVDKTPVEGQLVTFKVNNETDKPWAWEHFCDNAKSFELLALVASKEVAIDKPDCGNFKPQSFTVAPQTSYLYQISEFNTQLFNTPGSYRTEWVMTSGKEAQTLTSTEFEVKEAGWLRKSFRFLITQPLFNALVYFIEILPTHSLGWAIVLLTVGVRILLFWPNQKAMRSQRKLQKLQPHIQGLRKKYKDNQQMLAMETMAMYKKHKINPMSSCAPMLLQMPFLIGIYLVVKDGLSPHLSHLLYAFHENVDLSIVETYFLGLDLEIPNIFVLPVLVAVAQFIAIKLSMAAAKKQQNENGVTKSKKTKKDDAPDMMEQMEQMQKIMLWMLPLMIGFFTATFPAAVGVYWLTSTIFGIGQQKLVNWQLDRPQVRRKD